MMMILEEEARKVRGWRDYEMGWDKMGWDEGGMSIRYVTFAGLDDG